jgi:hypothetical protein
MGSNSHGLEWGRHPQSFLKAPRWFLCISRAENLWGGQLQFVLQDALCLWSSLTLWILPCPFLWAGRMKGISGLSQKQPDPERPHYKVKSNTLVPNILLMQLWSTDATFLECCKSKSTGPHLQPQLTCLSGTFLKEVDEAQWPSRWPVFKGNTTHLSFHSDEPSSLLTNTSQISNGMQKS